jgi:Domain of unknown function (DUF2382)
MSRMVAALYDSRAEAEFARARLISGLKAKSPRIIGKDTAGAVDGLRIPRADAEHYREGLRQGGHLLVAEVPGGTSARRIVDVLAQSADRSAEDRREEVPKEGDDAFRIEAARQAIAQTAQERAPDAPAPRPVEARPDIAGDMRRFAQMEGPREPEVADEARAPVAREELRIGSPELARAGAGARVRAFTHDAPAEEQVTLHDELVQVENRPSGRQLSESELEAGGLFKERVFEVAEMREEPVVTKVAVIREEVIVRKTLKERTETIRDTVRQTEVEVEDLPEEAPALFGPASSELPPAR